MSNIASMLYANSAFSGNSTPNLQVETVLASPLKARQAIPVGSSTTSQEQQLQHAFNNQKGQPGKTGFALGLAGLAAFTS